MASFYDLQQTWLDGGFTPPRLFYAVYRVVSSRNNIVFIVIDDTSTFYRLMDSYGKLYSIHQSQCYPQGTRYICTGTIYNISCSNYSPKDIYALNNILPIVFTGATFGY